MKIIAKTRAVLFSNKAETIVEVAIAFVVLSIVMVLFAQGMSYAQRAENYAIGKTNDCDDALKRLQLTVSGKENQATDETNYNVLKDNKVANFAEKDKEMRSLDGQEDMLKLKRYYVIENGDPNKFFYYVFDADLG